MATESVVIYGAGGLGSLVLDILEQAGRYRPVGFLDSNPQRHGQSLAGLPVHGGLEQADMLLAAGTTHAIVAVGDNAARVSLAETLVCRGFALASAIHPLATVSPSAELGPHVVIGPRVTVCVHARIGSHSVLLAGAIAEHDNVLGQGVFLHAAVRLAGGVKIADLALLGIGAAIIPGRTVGRAAYVHPGAVVIHDVPAEAAVAGVPAVPVNREGSRFTPEPRAAALGSQR